jgi:hypothetical protein
MLPVAALNLALPAVVGQDFGVVRGARVPGVGGHGCGCELGALWM